VFVVHDDSSVHEALTDLIASVGLLVEVVSGLLNKQIAAEFGSSEVTIKIHRGQVMRKMKAQSIVELVRTAEKIGITNTGSSHTKVL
jgi:FixJ family two-component response regulator